ncbi:MAG: biotin/lipoate A/B protein ligase family protein [Candidatus Thorarchaeota archaeon]
MSWRLLEGPDVDIYHSLAVEETLVRVCSQSTDKTSTLRLWKSDSAVVIGRFQCVHKEADVLRCERKGIPIARRFTGGGTVYQDTGNLNFTICADRSEPYVPRKLPDLYKTFVGEIAYELQQIGIPARFDKQRSCLRIKGRKISGTAGWIKRGVSFIHGTLLINADLLALKKCLEVPSSQPRYLRNDGKTRCLESKCDEVTNISSEVLEPPSEEEIRAAIVRSVEKIADVSVVRGHMTKEETDTAYSLYQSRYSLADWNLGTRAPE